ncbi:MAG: PEP-CTERM sorting domain-containing protein [Planctomycetes bacterium]|nr:PEP-CTERM sorting domain-containing protein [Planctomycetota bacterium]
MKTACTMILVLTVGASVAMADLVDSSFDSAIVQQGTWQAGTDAAGVWYGLGYSSSSGYADLVDVQQGNRTKDMNEARRSLFQAIELTEAGDFTWSLDCMLTEYNTEYCYWQAYLMKDGATIDLVGGPNYQQGLNKSKLIQSTVDYAPADKDGDQWYSYEQHFTITDKDVEKYDYIGFVLVGSRHDGEILAYDNVSTNYGGGGASAACSPEVPEPATMVLLGAGLGALLIRRKRAA